MALIKCSECGKKISDKAKSCPNCGCPIIKEKKRKKSKSKSKRRNLYFLITICIIVFGITLFLILKNNKNIYIGKWNYYENDTNLGINAYYIINKDGTFSFYAYYKNTSPEIVQYSGTQNVNKGKLYLYYTYENEPSYQIAHIENNKLCINNNCDDYYVKE